MNSGKDLELNIRVNMLMSRFVVMIRTVDGFLFVYSVYFIFQINCKNTKNIYLFNLFRILVVFGIQYFASPFAFMYKLKPCWKKEAAPFLSSFGKLKKNSKN